MADMTRTAGLPAFEGTFGFADLEGGAVHLLVRRSPRNGTEKIKPVWLPSPDKVAELEKACKQYRAARRAAK